MGDTSQPRIPALDGIRGIAILLVIANHAAIPGMRLAGGVGVTAFFVLSGYLITHQLLSPTLTLSAFWTRRVRRLAPALLLMVTVLFPLFLAAGMTAGHYWSEAAPGLLYYANFHEMSHYWSQPFGHLWSLSVEEQFYLGFPLVVLALRRNARSILVAAAVLASASAIARVWLAWDPATQMRAYFGVDTNAYALLLGAVIAAAVATGWRPTRQALPLGAGVALVTLTSVWPPVGPMYATTVPAAAGAALLIVAALGRDPIVFLEARPLRACGRVSYGWYLWQGPLLALTWPTTMPGHTMPKLAVCLAAFGVATLSWRFVEQRFLPRRAQPAPVAPVAVTQPA